MLCPTTLLYFLLLLWGLFTDKSFAASKKSRDAVLLTDVQALTLYGGRQTTHRRVSAIPQLKCTGGDAKGLYEIDVLRCKNQGTDYDELNVQWACTASLPTEFKLGSTDVICEGYSSPDDPYILKGSCGVQYKLFLTSSGEQKYGRRHDPSAGSLEGFLSKAFWFIFVGIIIIIIYVFIQSRRTDNGGRGFGPDGYDPPPPYDGPPPRKSSTNFQRTYGATGWNQQGGWRPGFWSGALGGAAAGYAAGSRNQNQNQGYQRQGSWGNSNAGGSGGFWSDRGSDTGTSGGSSSRHESQGFGSTSRR